MANQNLVWVYLESRKETLFGFSGHMRILVNIQMCRKVTKDDEKQLRYTKIMISLLTAGCGAGYTSQTGKKKKP